MSEAPIIDMGEIDLHDLRATLKEVKGLGYSLTYVDRGTGCGGVLTLSGPEWGDLIDFIEDSFTDGGETLNPVADPDDDLDEEDA